MLLAFALITAEVDNITLADALYLVFITGLAVGYGDNTPSSGVTRTISVLAGFVGVVFVGLVVAVSIRALEFAIEEAKGLQRGKLRHDEERQSLPLALNVDHPLYVMNDERSPGSVEGKMNRVIRTNKKAVSS